MNTADKIIADLLEWEKQLGSFEAQSWDRARQHIAALSNRKSRAVVKQTRDDKESDFEAWERGDRIEYAGYSITPSRDFGTKGTVDDHAWVIVKDGVNPMPGGTWGPSQDEACLLIDVLEAVGGDGQKFWHLLRAIQRATGTLK